MNPISRSAASQLKYMITVIWCNMTESWLIIWDWSYREVSNEGWLGFTGVLRCFVTLWRMPQYDISSAYTWLNTFWTWWIFNTTRKTHQNTTFEGILAQVQTRPQAFGSSDTFEFLLAQVDFHGQVILLLPWYGAASDVVFSLRYLGVLKPPK